MLAFRHQTLLLLTHIRERYGWKLPVLVVLMTVVALTEGLGMALLLPLLSVIGVSAVSEDGGLAKLLNVMLEWLGIGDSAYGIALFVLTVFALQLLVSVAQSWWVSSLQRDYGAYWQQRLFEVCIRAKWSFFSDQKLGDLNNLITQETIRLSGAFLILTQLASMMVAVLVYLAIAFSITWQVTLLIIALAFFLFGAVRGIGKKNYRIGLRLTPLASELNVLITEYFGGIKVIKATATENFVCRNVNGVVDDLRVQHTWATFLPSLVKAIFEFASIVMLCLILVFGYKNLGVAPASMLVVLALFIRLLPRFNALQQNMQLLSTYVPAFSAVSAVEAVARANAETIVSLSEPPPALTGPLRIDIKRGGYRGITTLHDIHLELPQTGLVGIIGESGAGKSTLANCLLGLADIEDGAISFGAIAMRDVPLAYWRRQIGYIPQETVLFHMPIRENIKWGTDANEDELYEAARQALAHEFILEQPDGYNTIIGDQGMRLSGGQRQRLGIARALLAKPRVLVMDEATSALDSASEAAVLETVNNLRRSQPIVMIAHRLATVRDADMIVVMDGGTITETGTWDDLMARRSALYRLAAAQHIL